MLGIGCPRHGTRTFWDLALFSTLHPVVFLICRILGMGVSVLLRYRYGDGWEGRWEVWKGMLRALGWHAHYERAC